MHFLHTVPLDSLLIFYFLKLAYEDILERAREKEEKEAKKRLRIADDFHKLLHMFKVWWHSNR